MLLRLIATASIAALALRSAGAFPANHAAAPHSTHQVVIEGVSFQPATLTVRPGDTVVWTNKDPFAHTVSATNGAFASPMIDPGASWKFKAQKSGEFSYFCTLHPTMKATLTVR